MNAVAQKVNNKRRISRHLPSHIRALAANPEPMPDELTDAEILQMAEWWAYRQFGEYAINNYSQEWGFQS